MMGGLKHRLLKHYILEVFFKDRRKISYSLYFVVYAGYKTKNTVQFRDDFRFGLSKDRPINKLVSYCTGKRVYLIKNTKRNGPKWLP